jgi:hypothetical protein
MPPRPDIQRGSSHAVLPNSMAARPLDLHPETREGTGATLAVSSHKYTGHDCPRPASQRYLSAI